MPANPGDGSRRQSRAPREWSELDTPHGFERCVRATLRELYGYVALLTGRDRRAAERIVGEVYRSLFQAVRAGHVEAVTLGALRSAGRRIWLDEHRGELVAVDEVSRAPASTIAELSILERAVLVFRQVNGMSVERCAAELGRSERDVSVVGAHAVRRLRGTDDTSGAWLRAYLGPTVTPAGGLVDRIVRQLGDAVEAPAGTPVEEPAVEESPVEEPPVEESPVEEPPVEEPPVEEPPLEEPGASDLPAADLPTEELAAVDRATVELPAVVPEPAPAAEPDPEPVVPEPIVPAPETSDADGRRPVWIVAIGALLVVALVAALVWLALRGDADDTVASAPSTTVSVTTTLAATTSTAPASSVPPSTVAAAPVELGFDPACTETTSTDPGPAAWSDSFGPLPAEPTLVVTLPESVDVTAEPDRAPVRPSVVAGAGGVIVSARSAPTHRAQQTIVARIAVDGSVVWVRCLAGDVEIASEPDAGVDLAARTVGGDTWTARSLEDGSEGAELDELQRAALDDPPDADSADGPTLGFSYDGELQRSVPAGLDDGQVLWTASDVVLPASGTAFRAIAVGDVALVQSCDVPDCGTGELRGYDLASGELRWSRPGVFEVAASGDGFALVGDGSGWELIDVASGTAVDGQIWDDPTTFAVDESDGVSSVEQQGGAVIVARPGLVSVWLPGDVGSDTAEVEIP